MGRLKHYLIATVLALVSMQGLADDQQRALQLRESGEILPLEEILVISRKQVDGRILEVELKRKHGVLLYEIKILDINGRVWELKVDASNGTIIEREQE